MGKISVSRSVRRTLLLRGALRGRVSMLALLVAACGNNGTSAPITGGALPNAAPSTSAQVGDESTPGTTSPLGIVTVEAPKPVVSCAPASSTSFDDMGIGPTPRLEKRVLYSWTTLEQAAELIAGGSLLSRTERPGEGPGHAIEYLRDMYAPVSDDDAKLRELLLSEPFSRARYAWPYAWATRMGWPASDQGPAEAYGNQLLRIAVKPEAVWVVVAPRGLRIFDNEGVQVASADPSRIAGIYFARGESTGGATCGGSFGAELFTSFREFIVMNPNMIESWELGTEAVRDAVRADIGHLERFFEAIRSCPEVATVEVWATSIVCSNWNVEGVSGGAYVAQLALLNANYLPRAAEIAAIVETLKKDVEDWELEVPPQTTDRVDGDDAGVASRAGDSSVSAESAAPNEPQTSPGAASSDAVSDEAGSDDSVTTTEVQ